MRPTVYDPDFPCGRGNHAEHLSAAMPLSAEIADIAWTQGAYDGRSLIPVYGKHIAAGAVSLAVRSGVCLRRGWLIYPRVDSTGGR